MTKRQKAHRRTKHGAPLPTAASNAKKHILEPIYSIYITMCQTEK